MKINEEKLNALIEETICYGAAYGEEVDLTTNKVMEHLKPLIIAVKELNTNTKQPMTQEQNEQLIKEMENRLDKYNNQGSKSKNAENILFAKIGELSYCIQLIKQTTVNRSSTEPKFIEG